MLNSRWLISQYGSQKSKSYHRPRFIAEDQELDDYYIALINQKMAGIKVANRLYGWIAYFQAMTDIYFLLAFGYCTRPWCLLLVYS